jgi:predicted ester cyclase
MSYTLIRNPVDGSYARIEEKLSTSEKLRKGVCSMSTEDNKALLRHYYDEVINKKNRAAIDEYIDPNFVDHAAPSDIPAGIEGQKQVFSMYSTAFPDTHFKVEDMIAEGDRAVARLSVSATQQGTFLGLPPTGKHVTFTGIDIIRIAGGKLVERWGEMDMLGLLQQLGIVPLPGQAN